MPMPPKNDSAEPVDIRSVRVDTSLPQKERIADYVRQVGTPYHYIDGGIGVTISFADTDTTLEELLLSYLKRKV